MLFWLSLVPFVTSWVGENHFAALPLACYGFILFMSSSAYFILAKCLANNNEALRVALGKDRKGKLSSLLYLTGIGVSLLAPMAGFAIYVAVAMMWFIPDRRFERR
ncbi:hypothetical protein Jab_1c00520 [Janthinobacterium sp. HH01]|uniref:TMEM175 family protein n=1 Tax=Janthinobacterium sp. HH01 TaxID=1198452 RepID=UPI0002AEAC90|nr:hypothetical protein [Janthinobacterium sp. HH01]ELX11469.1 hypothetical protein Jab_1c00520 [Janthinobacterium sp. HH01]